MGKSTGSVVRQQASKAIPISEEKAKLTILNNIGKATENLKSNGGFTLDPRTGKLVNPGEQRGYMMSPLKNNETVQLPFNQDMTSQDIMNAIPQSYWPRLQRGGYLGSWLDNGQVYLDPAERYMTKIKSLEHGLKSEQLSGTNLKIPFGEAGNEPFYNVTPEEYQKQLDLIKKRAITAMIGGTTVGIPAGLYGYNRSK